MNVPYLLRCVMSAPHAMGSATGLVRSELSPWEAQVSTLCCTRGTTLGKSVRTSRSSLLSCEARCNEATD